MPQYGIIYRVLVASPSDCDEERKLVPKVIRAWNAAHSSSHATILEPVLWELHARPELGRPQKVINKQIVDNCDILIGTFRKKLGSPTGKAESGTAEEIEKFHRKGKTALIYFSSSSVAPNNLDPKEFRRLKDYRQKIGQKALYSTYKSFKDLEERLQKDLAKTMNDLHSSERDISGDYIILGSKKPLTIVHLRDNRYRVKCPAQWWEGEGVFDGRRYFGYFVFAEDAPHGGRGHWCIHSATYENGQFTVHGKDMVAKTEHPPSTWERTITRR